MPEIKRTFSTGRMNKDLDERLVPNGEYRDALNIQVRTTDGDAAGTIQNIQGNRQVGTTTGSNIVSSSVCVGSVADERADKAYFLFASDNFINQLPQNLSSKKIYVDYIIQQDYRGETKPVFVDIFAVEGSRANAGNPTSGANWHTLSGFEDKYTDHYRPGMTFVAYDANGDPITEPNTFITEVGANSIKVNKVQADDITGAVALVAYADKTLGFNNNTLVTGINVLDDFLFFTDNNSEPKQINIPACIAGTTSDTLHTKVMVKNEVGDYVSPSSWPSKYVSDHMSEKYVTVIKSPPRLAPKIEFLEASDIGNKTFTLTSFTGFIVDGGPIAIGNTVSIPSDGFEDINVGVGDTIVFSSTIGTSEVQVTARVLQVPFYFIFSTNFIVQIISVSPDIESDNVTWDAEILDSKKSIFVDKFPRFAFRYKYDDNEYSSFSPWSEIAFAPGQYDYNAVDGYHKSMENRIKEIRIKDFLEDEKYRPANVKAIDVLYRSSDSPLVYIVKTIERNFSPEWVDSKDIIISSEMIHLAVPENQSLRVWDNVPRYAKSQEIVGNRLIYGNYTQGYNLKNKPIIEHAVISNNIEDTGSANKSIKSIRSYKLGLVLGDKYGRETPVIAVGNKNNQVDNLSGNQSAETSILDQSYSKYSNRLEVAQNWSNGETALEVPSWAEYCKYYIKETSNEYYNLPLERWYSSKDNQLWLAFPSSERNKVDENSYLILKKSSETDDPIDTPNKYKILSIKNEAPRFIKTKLTQIGSLHALQAAGNQYYGGFASSETVNFQVGSVDDGEVINTDISDLANADFKGERLVRAVCNLGLTTHAGIIYNIVLRTPYRSIVSFIEYAEGSMSSITIAEPFGESGNFRKRLVETGAVTTDVVAGIILDTTGVVKYEIVDSVEKNDPEFEGSFFVKVKRDNVLDNNIIGSSGVTANYEPTLELVSFKYIDTNSGINPSTTGSQKDYEWDDSGYFENSDINGNYFASCNGSTATRQYWQDTIGEFDEGVFDSGGIDEAVVAKRIWIDGAASKGAEAHDAFSSSGLAVDGTSDIIALSCMKKDTQAGFMLLGMVMNSNTVFKFSQDDNQTYYRIVEHLSTVEYYNYGTSDSTAIEGRSSCLNCLESEDYCKRIRVTFRFERLNSQGINVLNTGIDLNQFDPRGTAKHDGSGDGISMEFYSLSTEVGDFIEKAASLQPAIFETEPKENVDLDIYYEASSAIPQRLNYKTIGYFAPVNSKVKHIYRNGEKITLSKPGYVKAVYDDFLHIVRDNTDGTAFSDSIHNVHVDDIVTFEHADGTVTRSKVEGYGTFSNTTTFVEQGNQTFVVDAASTGATTITKTSGTTPNVGDEITAGTSSIPSNTYIVSVSGNNINISNPLTGNVNAATTITFKKIQGIFKLDSNVYNYRVQLPWFNCYSYGNGVESNRIRDDFNKPFIGNGLKVSTTFTDYNEENISNGLIYSGLYNSTSSVNELNQFNMAEKITKELNPDYGSIQALKTRDTDLITFTEDKVLRILANKDALFNADGNTNITASDRVLGQAVPYVGDYGISKNPESLASDQYRIYFTDKQRGAVLRLSRDGLTPISNVGMKNWFRDNLRDCDTAVGSFDIVNGEYNITIKPERYTRASNTTVSFNEASKGWVSFKSFIVSSGLSIAGKYLTANGNKIWEHYSSDAVKNHFYGQQYSSTFTAIINDMPGSSKTFKTVNYEGTEGKSVNVNKVSVDDPDGVGTVEVSDGLYDNLTTPTDGTGWSAEISTEYQKGIVEDFRGKESKWFGYVIGDQKAESSLHVDDINISDFSTQGLGIPKTVANRSQNRTNVKVTIKN